MGTQPTMDDIAKIKAAWDRDIAAWSAKVEALRGLLEPFADAWRVAVARGPKLTLAEIAVIAKHHTDSTAFKAADAALSVPVEERRTSSSVAESALPSVAPEAPSPAGMDREFAEELSERLLMIAQSGHLKGARTHFRGEIRTMANIVKIAANVMGKPIRAEESSGQSDEETIRQLARDLDGACAVLRRIANYGEGIQGIEGARAAAKTFLGTTSLPVPAQPVAWQGRSEPGRSWEPIEDHEYFRGCGWEVRPLYAHPAPAEARSAWAPTQTYAEQVAAYNAVFDPAHEAGQDAFNAGFREGWIFANTCEGGEAYEDASERYVRAVDGVELGEAWDAHRDAFFKRLPLAALPPLPTPPKAEGDQ